MIQKCTQCGYLWEYSGKMIWATCPSCRLKVKVMKGGKDGKENM